MLRIARPCAGDRRDGEIDGLAGGKHAGGGSIENRIVLAGTIEIEIRQLGGRRLGQYQMVEMRGGAPQKSR